MSQFYDQASLVMIPSGYKTGKVYSQKPLSADGELTFTRASNATRIGPDGKLEKVRTNLLLQSNQFDTTWAVSSMALTSGQSGYDGTNNAWLLDISASSANLRQSTTTSGYNTFSVYAKKGSLTWLRINNNVALSYFDLQNVTTGTTSGTGFISSSITSVGNGWVRCSLTFLGDASVSRFYPADADNGLPSSGNIYLQNAQLEVSDFGATDYIPTTTAAVSVGPVSGLPRLDYSGGCPSLLLEPQRTNLLPYSEQLNSQTLQGSPTITSNVAVSPDGYQNADKLKPNGSNSYVGAFKIGMGNNTYSISMFAKADGKDWVFFYEIGSAVGTNGVWFNVANGTIGSVGSAWSNAKIEDYGNGWYRVSATTTLSGGNYLYWLASDGNGSTTLSENGTDGVLMWGISYEAGAYATSYIPTLGSAVTRLADAAYKTGISSLIGQTEGTVFMDFVYNGLSATYEEYGLYASSTNRIGLYLYLEKLRAFIIAGGSSAFETDMSGTLVIGQRYKVAFAYKSGDSKCYINGSSTFTNSANFTFSTSLANFALSTYNGQFHFHNPINQTILFPTALTPAQLAELTTL